MKLNLLPYVAPPKIDQIKENGLPSPIGWWKVTTEGDCEGRTTKQLGEHFGHVAEIAFELGHNGGYVLEFDKIEKPERPEIPIRQAKTNKIFVRVNKPNYNCNWLEKDFKTWMDAPQLKISEGNFWKSFLLEFVA